MVRVINSLAVIFASFGLLVIASCGGHDRISGDADPEDIFAELEDDALSDPVEADGGELVPPCTTEEDCNDLDPCTEDDCETTTGTCSNILVDVDVDGDGFLDLSCPGGDDCDDGRMDVHPGAYEVCGDGIDQDCDGVVDERLNPHGEIKVSDDPYDSVLPSVAWTGSEFGIAWRDDRDETCGTLFAILSSEGEVSVEGYPIAVEDCWTAYGGLSMAWTGSEFGIVWLKLAHSLIQLGFFTRVDMAGNEIIDETVLTTEVGPIIQMPAIAWTGSDFGLIHGYSGHMFFNRLSAEGNVIGSAIQIESGGDYSEFSMAWTGSIFGATYLHNHATAVAILDAEGNRLPGSWHPDWSDLSDEYPDIVWADGMFGLSWEWGNITRFTRMDPVGLELEPMVYPGGMDFDNQISERPSLAWTGSEFGIAWEDGRNTMVDPGNIEIYVSLISATGTDTDDDYRISTSSGFSEEPAIAWTGSEFGIAWQDDRDGDFDIHFAHVSVCP